MTQLDMIADTIAKLEATVDAAAEPLCITPSAAEPGPAAEVARSPNTVPASKPPTRTLPQKKTNPTLVGVRPSRRPSKAPRTKKAVLRSLVERKNGASMQAMMEATGWQAHSVRAGLTGLRKAGIELERRTNRKGETVYAVVQSASPQ